MAPLRLSIAFVAYNQESFVEAALLAAWPSCALQADPALAGVAGYVVDTRIANDIDRIRVRNGLSTRAGDAVNAVGPISTNRTRSPARRSAAGCRSGSKSRSGDRPMMFQPPGTWSG